MHKKKSDDAVVEEMRRWAKSREKKEPIAHQLGSVIAPSSIAVVTTGDRVNRSPSITRSNTSGALPTVSQTNRVTSIYSSPSNSTPNSSPLTLPVSKLSISTSPSTVSASITTRDQSVMTHHENALSPRSRGRTEEAKKKDKEKEDEKPKSERAENKNGTFSPDVKEFYVSLLKTVCSTTGMDASSQNQILDMFLTKLKDVPASSHKAEQTLPRQAIQNLNKMITNINGFIQDQSRIRNIIKVQSLVRRWLVRKHYVELDYEKFNIRNTLIYELVAGEKKYVTDLEEIVKYHLIPLRHRCSGKTKSTSSPITISEVVALFSNIESIYNLQRELVTAILDIVDDSKWPFINVSRFARLFLSMSSKFAYYEEYVKNSMNAKSILTSIKAKKPKVLQELRDSSPSKEDLENLLALPIQHLSIYENFFDELLGCINTDNEEVLDAFAVLQRCTQLVKEKQQAGFAYAVLHDIQRRLVYERPLNLVEEGRDLVKEGVVLPLQKSKKKFFLFLLNNLLVVTKTSSKSDKCKVVELVHNKHLEIEELNDGKVGYFRLSTPSSKYEFCGRTPEETTTWVKELQLARAKNKVYGAPLSEVIERGTGPIPPPVASLIKWLKSNALDIEGIFRLSGDLKAMASIKPKLDRMDINEDELFKSLRPHDASSLLKHYFKELPEPLITYELYPKLISLQRDQGLSRQERLQQLHTILQTLPKSNFALLKYLSEFLATVSCHSEENRMHSRNLATVFTPNLLRSRESAMENARDIPYATSIVQSLIDNAGVLFLSQLPDNPEFRYSIRGSTISNKLKEPLK